MEKVWTADTSTYVTLRNVLFIRKVSKAVRNFSSPAYTWAKHPDLLLHANHFMKKTLSVLLVAATGFTGIGLAHAQENTSSGTTVPAASQQHLVKHPFNKALGFHNIKQRPPMDFSMEKLDNGVILTRTSTNADVVKKIQEEASKEGDFLAKRPDLKDVQVSTANVDNGVKITLTSTDADTVTKLQTGPAHPMPPRGRETINMLPENVQFTVEKTDTGVVLKRTSTDADTVKKLQEMEAKHTAAGDDKERPQPDWMKNVQVTVTNLDNGVQTTMSGSDADTIAKIQEFANKPAPAFRVGHRGKPSMDKTATQE